MSDSGAAVSRPVEFEASDGAELLGDLHTVERVVAASIVCHPHPQYGGNRHHPVVTAMADALTRSGIVALRFDFRQRFDDGVGERLDALAAIDELADSVHDVPLVAVGYSFGALVTLALRDPRVVAQVLIAPPLTAVEGLEAPTVPTLVIVPAHDQFSPPEPTDAVLAQWRAATDVTIDREIVESADHFLAGHTRDVGERAAAWLRRQLPPSPP